MMKKTLIIICCLFLFHTSYTQTNFPRGAYKNYFELITKQPSIPYAFKIKKRSIGGIKMNGGADYKVTCTDGSVMLFEIESQIYAISTGDTLYLNCFFQKVQDRYAKVISEGKYLAFNGPLNNIDIANYRYQRGSSKKKSNENSDINPKTIRKLYILSEYAIAIPLNRVRLRKMLEPYPDLLKQYLSEPDMDDQETMLHYFLIINEASSGMD